MQRFVKKPEFIDAIMWDEKRSTLDKLIECGLRISSYSEADGSIGYLRIYAAGCIMCCRSGDWIVWGADSDFFRCSKLEIDVMYDEINAVAPKMMVRGQGEAPASYMLRVAARHIRNHCPGGATRYDGAVFSGHAIARECEMQAADEI